MDKASINASSYLDIAPVAIARPFQRSSTSEISSKLKIIVPEKSYQQKVIENKEMSPNNKFDNIRLKQKTIGVVEPRVVVKIPWSKVTPKLPSTTDNNRDRLPTNSRILPIKRSSASTNYPMQKQKKYPKYLNQLPGDDTLSPFGHSCNIDADSVRLQENNNSATKDTENSLNRSMAHINQNHIGKLKNKKYGTKKHKRRKLYKREKTKAKNKGTCEPIDVSRIQSHTAMGTQFGDISSTEMENHNCDRVSDILPDHFKQALKEHRLRQETISKQNTSSPIQDQNLQIRNEQRSDFTADFSKNEVSKVNEKDTQLVPSRHHKIKTLKLIRKTVPGTQKEKYLVAEGSMNLKKRTLLNRRNMRETNLPCTSYNQKTKLNTMETSSVYNASVKGEETGRRIEKNISKLPCLEFEYSESNIPSHDGQISQNTEQECKSKNNYNEDQDMQDIAFAKYNNDKKCFMFSDLVATNNISSKQKIDNPFDNDPNRIHAKKRSKRKNRRKIRKEHLSSKSVPKNSKRDVLSSDSSSDNRDASYMYEDPSNTTESRQKHRNLVSESNQEYFKKSQDIAYSKSEPKWEDEGGISSKTINCITKDISKREGEYYHEDGKTGQANVSNHERMTQNPTKQIKQCITSPSIDSISSQSVEYNLVEKAQEMKSNPACVNKKNEHERSSLKCNEVVSNLTTLRANNIPKASKVNFNPKVNSDIDSMKVEEANGCSMRSLSSCIDDEKDEHELPRGVCDVLTENHLGATNVAKEKEKVSFNLLEDGDKGNCSFMDSDNNCETELDSSDTGNIETEYIRKEGANSALFDDDTNPRKSVQQKDDERFQGTNSRKTEKNCKSTSGSPEIKNTNNMSAVLPKNVVKKNGDSHESVNYSIVGKQTVNISIECETDGEWMFCKIKGCNFWTRKKVRMERHIISHVPGDNRFYQCPEPDCGIRMCSLPKLLRHDRKKHTGFKDYECKICEAEVTDITVHMRVSEYFAQLHVLI